MKYLDKYTFTYNSAKLLSTEDHANGNMLRSTSELLLLDQTDLSIEERAEYEKGIDLCIVKDAVGLYSRYPDSVSNTSVDDYLALGTDSVRATSILFEARTDFGFLDVHQEYDWKQFIFRFQSLWQHLRISAKENVGIVGQLIWALGIVLAAREPIERQDNWLLSHMMIITRQRRGFKSLICDLAEKYWRSKKTKSSSDIMLDYCRIPDHPLIEAWRLYK